MTAGARTAGPQAVPLAPPVIELRGVGFSYPGQRRPGERNSALSHPDHRRLHRLRPRCHRPAQHRQSGLAAPALSLVDLTVRSGELVTLTGRARSGRSTLLGVIGLLLRPTTGTYLLNGLDTARLGDRDLAALRAREIGYVHQPPHLLPSRSALDNVMLPLLYTGMPGRLRRSAAIASLDRVGLAAQAQIAAGELSAGERQRVAIARALVAGPGLLLCDDPTASLDVAVAAQIIGLLNSLHSDGRTVLLATKDQLAAAYSSRCVSIGGNAGTEPAAAR